MAVQCGPPGAASTWFEATTDDTIANVDLTQAVTTHAALAIRAEWLGPKCPVEGSSVTLTVCITQAVTCALFDPESVVVRLRSPNDDVTEIVADRTKRGHYTAEPVFDLSGKWRWRIEAIGDVDGAAEGFITIHARLD